MESAKIGSEAEDEVIKQDESPVKLSPLSINKLEKKGMKLFKQQKYLESLKIIKEVIKQKQIQLGGSESEEFLGFTSEMVKIFNQVGMQLVNQDNFKISYKLFKQLIRTTKKLEQPKLASMLNLTYNNLSCCFKRMGKIKEAQKCLEKALALQNDNPVPITSQSADSNYSLTELNLCAVYSQLNNHQKSKEFALQAVVKIQVEVDQLNIELASLDKQGQDQMKPILLEKIQLLAIAHYNLGSQQEFLNQYPDCINSYEHALNLLNMHLQKGNPLINEFQQSLKQAKVKFQQKNTKNEHKTFTNLSKTRANQEMTQNSLSRAQFQQNNSRSSNNVQQRKPQRPMSASVANQRLHDHHQQNAPIPINSRYNQVISPIERHHEQDSNQSLRQTALGIKKKQRPSSSYVRGGIPRQGEAIPQDAYMSSSSLPRGGGQSSQMHAQTLSQDFIDIVDESMNMNQHKDFSRISPQSKGQKQLNSLIEFAFEDDQNEDEESELYPLMQENVHYQTNYNQYARNKLTRPASAKTYLSNNSQQKKKQQLKQSAHNVNSNASSSKAFFSIRQSHGDDPARITKIEKVYASNEAQLRGLREMQQQQQQQQTFQTRDSSLGKPPTQKKKVDQMRLGKQKSQSKIQNNIQTSGTSGSHFGTIASGILNNIAPRPQQKSSQQLLQKNGLNGGQQLFELIDKSFNILNQEQSNEKDLNTQIAFGNQKELGQIYLQEQLRQQYLFHQNNNDPAVEQQQQHQSHNITSPPQQQQQYHHRRIPQTIQHTKQELIQEKSRVQNKQNQKKIDEKSHPKNIRARPPQNQQAKSNNSSQNRRQQPHNLSQGKIKPRLSRPASPPSFIANQYYSNNNQEINQINNINIQERVFYSLNNQSQNVFEKPDSIGQNFNYLQQQNKEAANSDKFKIIHNSNHKQDKKVSNLIQNDIDQLQELTIIKLQRTIKAYLARKRFKMVVTEQAKSQLLLKRVFKFNEHGYCHIYLYGKGTKLLQFEIVVRSVQHKTKLFQRQFTRKDFEIKQTVSDSEIKTQLDTHFDQAISKFSGNLYTDIMLIGQTTQHQQIISPIQLTSSESPLQKKEPKEGRTSFMNNLQSMIFGRKSTERNKSKNREAVENTDSYQIDTSLNILNQNMPHLNESWTSQIKQVETEQMEDRLIVTNKKEIPQSKDDHAVKIQAAIKGCLVRLKLQNWLDNDKQKVIVKFKKTISINGQESKQFLIKIFSQNILDDVVLIKARLLANHVDKIAIKGMTYTVPQGQNKDSEIFKQNLIENISIKLAIQDQDGKTNDSRLLKKQNYELYMISEIQQAYKQANIDDMFALRQRLQQKQAIADKRDEGNKDSYFSVPQSNKNIHQAPLNVSMGQLSVLKHNKSGGENNAKALNKTLTQKLNQSSNKSLLYDQIGKINSKGSQMNQSFITNTNKPKRIIKKDNIRKNYKSGERSINGIKNMKSPSLSKNSKAASKLGLNQSNIYLTNELYKEDEELKGAAIKIQAVFKGKQQRKALRQQNDAKIVLQVNNVRVYQSKNQDIFRDFKIQVKEYENTLYFLCQYEDSDSKLPRQDIEHVFNKEDYQYYVLDKTWYVQQIITQKLFLDEKAQIKMIHKFDDINPKDTVVKIQAAFRGKRARQNFKQIQTEKEKQVNEQQLKEQQELEQAALKIQQVFKNRQLRLQKENENKRQKKDDVNQYDDEIIGQTIEKFRDLKLETPAADKESICIFEVKKLNQIDSKTSTQLVEAQYNNTKKMIILKAEGLDSLSVFIDDFIKRYKDQNTLISNKSECFAFLRRALPIYVQIQKNKIIVIKQSKDTEMSHSNAVNKDLEDILTISHNHASQNLEEYYEKQNISKQSILVEKQLSDIKIEGQNQAIRIIMFKTPNNGLNIRASIEYPQTQVHLTIIDKQRLSEISGVQYKTNEEVSEIMIKELDFRILMLNKGLDEGETMKFQQLKDLINAYSPDGQSPIQQLMKISDIETQAKKIQQAFKGKLLKRKNNTQAQNNDDQKKIETQKIQQAEQIKANQLDTQKQQTLNEALKPKIKESMTIIKQRMKISGQEYSIEVKLNNTTDQFFITASQVNHATAKECNSALQLIIDDIQANQKSLQQLYEQAQNLTQKLEIDSITNSLRLRNGLEDYSILSSNVIFKKGIEISGRFMLVSVSVEDNYITFDAYEEKTEKRMEFRIRKTNKHKNINDADIIRLIDKLEIRKIGDGKGGDNGGVFDEDDDEILILRA